MDTFPGNPAPSPRTLSAEALTRFLRKIPARLWEGSGVDSPLLHTNTSDYDFLLTPEGFVEIFERTHNLCVDQVDVGEEFYTERLNALRRYEETYLSDARRRLLKLVSR